MLKDLLKEINQTKAFSTAHVSKKFKLSEDTVKDMILQLVRMGYLIEDLGTIACETSCGKCPYARICNANPTKLYRLSKKGQKLLQ